MQVGGIVLISFASLLAPFLSIEQTLQLLRRIFPMSRGLYEVRGVQPAAVFYTNNRFNLQDKVASFWCVVSPIYKFNRWPIEQVAKARYIRVYSTNSIRTTLFDF